LKKVRPYLKNEAKRVKIKWQNNCLPSVRLQFHPCDCQKKKGRIDAKLGDFMKGYRSISERQVLDKNYQAQ
jgi:hypothetical protein